MKIEKYKIGTAVSPSIAVISAGIDNPYGHPHQETLDKLFTNQITVYGTYQSGTIAILANLTSVQALNDPTPIPDLSMPIIMASLTIILSIAIIYKRKNNQKLSHNNTITPKKSTSM